MCYPLWLCWAAETTVGKFLRICGWVWICAAVAVILLGYGAPIWAALVTIVALAPGIGLVVLGNSITGRRGRKSDAAPHS